VSFSHLRSNLQSAHRLIAILRLKPFLMRGNGGFVSSGVSWGGKGILGRMVEICSGGGVLNSSDGELSLMAGCGDPWLVLSNTAAFASLDFSSVRRAISNQPWLIFVRWEA